MALAGMLATFRIGSPPPTDTWIFFVICGGALVLFVALVALVAGVAKRREDRREGRGAPDMRRRWQGS